METTHSTYLDFEVEIGPGRGREYPVSVVRSPVGEARRMMHFPYDELSLENRLNKLQSVSVGWPAAVLVNAAFCTDNAGLQRGSIYAK